MRRGARPSPIEYIRSIRRTTVKCTLKEYLHVIIRQRGFSVAKVKARKGKLFRTTWQREQNIGFLFTSFHVTVPKTLNFSVISSEDLNVLISENRTTQQDLRNLLEIPFKVWIANY